MIKIKKRSLLILPFVILFFIYVILASLVSIIIPNTYMRILIEWIGLFGIVLLCKGVFKIYRNDTFIVLFFLLLLVNLYRCNNNTFFDMAIMMPYILLCFFCRRDISWIELAYKILIFSNTIYAILTIFFYFNSGIYSSVAMRLFPSSYNRLIGWYNDGCMAGLTSHYTINGLLMAMGTFMIFCQLLENWGNYTKQSKLIKVCHLMLFVISLLLTGKRGPVVFIGAAMFAVYYLHLSNRPKGRIVRIIGIGILVICLFAILFSIFPSLSTFLNRFISLSESGDITLGRERYWQLAIMCFARNPIFGIGWGRFEAVSAEMYSNAVDAHNNYLQILCETGIVGFLIFMGMALAGLYRTVKLYQQCILKSEETFYTYLIAFSVGFQIFFLLYGFSGNPLYTTITYMPYFVCYIITRTMERKMIEEENV